MTEYRHDRAAWASEQARLLRQHKLDGIDRSNVASELQQLFAGDEEMLRLRIRVLLTALLRWAYQADLRSNTLASTITSQRIEIDRITEDGATLRAMLENLVVGAYPEAKRAAVVESGLFEESFPEGLPFLPREVLDLSFLPDAFDNDIAQGGA